MEKEQTRCLNCQTVFTGQFCPECGQAASTKRFDTKELLSSLLSSLFSGDNKFFSTCTSLLWRPGHLVREFLLGQRTRYYKPMPLLVFLITIYAILDYLLGNTVSIFNILDLNQTTHYSSPTVQSFSAMMNSILSNRIYFCIYSVALNLLPYRLVFSRQRIGRPDGTDAPLNVAEHFIALSYLMCMNMLLSFFVLPFSLIHGADKVLRALFIYLPTLFSIVIYKQMLGISWMKGIVLNIMTLMLSILLTIACLLLFVGLLYGYDAVSA